MTTEESYISVRKSFAIDMLDNGTCPFYSTSMCEISKQADHKHHRCSTGFEGYKCFQSRIGGEN